MMLLTHCPGIYTWEQLCMENNGMRGLKNFSDFSHIGIYDLSDPFALRRSHNDLVVQEKLKFP